MKKEPKDRWLAYGDLAVRKEREDYSSDDGRVSPEDCQHTQFLDMAVPGQATFSIGRCLDCGHAIRSAVPRTLFSEVPEPLLTDDGLKAQRDIHRAIWFSDVHLPENVSPGR